MKLQSIELQNKIKICRDLVNAKDYERAERLLVDVLKEHELADVYNLLGLTYADTGQFKAAEFAFQKALEINPHYMEAALNLSVLYNNLGMGKKSKVLYKRLKKYGASGRGAMDPLLMSRIANLYADIGDLYLGVGEYKDAADAFEKAVDLCPSYIDVQTKLATAYREAGQHTKAMKVFDGHKRKASNYAPFWVALGVTYYALNKMPEAKRAWKKALKIDPDNKSAAAFSQLEGPVSKKLPAKKRKKKKTAQKKVQKKRSGRKKTTKKKKKTRK